MDLLCVDSRKLGERGALIIWGLRHVRINILK